MGFKLEQIDRAIEWALRDQTIAQGLWPPQRTFITNADEPGFIAALAAMTTKVEVFGTADYKDRKQLKPNNCIIERVGIGDGEIGFAEGFRFQMKTNKDYQKIKTAKGTNHIYYEVRFVCDDVTLDRKLAMIIEKSLGRYAEIPGINTDLTNTENSFAIVREGPSGDVSGKDFIERVYRYVVQDVSFDDLEEVVDDGIAPITQIKTITNTAGPIDPDVQYPDDINDATETTIGVNDYIIGHLGDIAAWRKFISAHWYANDTQAHALKDLIRTAAAPSVNTGLTFSKLKGFNKTAAGQSLATGFAPTAFEDFGLTSFSYAIFVTDVPPSGLLELFGLVDVAGGTSFYLRSHATTGFTAKGNSNNELALATLKAKANTLYVLNSRNRHQLEIFEGDNMIGKLELEPTQIPAGSFAELSTLDEDATAIGTSTAGGIGFSAIGAGLTGTEIKELNEFVRFLMTRCGVIP